MTLSRKKEWVTFAQTKETAEWKAGGQSESVMAGERERKPKTGVDNMINAAQRQPG